MRIWKGVIAKENNEESEMETKKAEINKDKEAKENPRGGKYRMKVNENGS
jgi:hypothetical protein